MRASAKSWRAAPAECSPSQAVITLRPRRGAGPAAATVSITALAQAEDAARAVIDTVAAAGPAPLRGRNVINAWLGEHSAGAARQLFADARVATYETPDS